MSIALFLCLSKQSQFCVVRPAMVDGQYQLNHVATIYAPEVGTVNLLFFCLILLYNGIYTYSAVIVNFVVIFAPNSLTWWTSK